MLEFMNSGLLIEALGLALLHSLWQGLLIGILFKAVLSAMSQASPQTRYWASVGSLALLAASVPLTTMYLLAGVQPLPASNMASAAASNALADSARVGAGAMPAGIPVVEWTVAFWVVGVAIVATRTLMSWRRLSGLRRAADIEAASGLAHIVERLRGVFGLSGKIAIGVSASIGSPMIVGWMKPMILLPPAIAARLPREQLEMIIAHELAHLRRQDHWVNLFQVATETLMFYHPAVAMVSRRIRIERENACDDLAVAATRRRLDYVEMLAALERQRGPGPALALGVHDGQVVARIRRLVERSEPGNSRGAAIPALIALAAVAGLLAAPLIEETAVERQTAGTDPNPPSSMAVESGSGFPERPDRVVPVSDESTIEAPVPDQPDSIQTPAVAVPQIGVPGISGPVATGPASTARDDIAAAPAESMIEERADSSSDPSAPEPSALAQAEQGSQAGELPYVPEGVPDFEAPQPDPDTLLASRIETPIPLPKDTPVVAENTRPLNGNAQRAARAVLAGGELLREIQPAYPRSALRREISGSVEVELKIAASGRVAEVSILSETPADAGFGAAARRAASDWRFEPFTVDGQPAAQRKTVVFDFEPGDGCRMVTGTRLPSC